MPSPPKPWEKAAGGSMASSSSAPPPPLPDASSQPTPADAASLTSSFMSSQPPELPNRPMNSLNPSSSLARPGYGSPYNNPYSYGSSYGGYGSTYGGYGSGASTYGAYGSGYGGYGSSYGSSYGSPYNRYGVGYSGYSGYGRPGMYNRFGMPGAMGEGDIPLTARVEQSTQQAFYVLDQIVQAFTGFSHMLDSTFHATHSSFMAMVGVAEQFGHLRNYLGQVLSILSLVRFVKSIINKLLGKSPPPDELNLDDFASFSKGGNDESKKSSSRPLWIFTLFMVGIPWLMSKWIKKLQQKKLDLNTNVNTQDQPIISSQQIKDLEFCKAVYDFVGENPCELSFKKGELIAILSKTLDGQPSAWWKGRLQNGSMGLFPSNYVEILTKALPPKAVESK